MALTDIANGATAQASDVQQVIDLLKGTAGKGVPVSLTAINDALNYGLAIRNNDAGASKAFIVYKSDGTILFQVDKNGVIASADGTTAAAQIPTLTATQTLTNKTLTAPHMTTPVVDSGGLTVTAGRVSIGGTGLVAGDFALSASWGSTTALLIAQGGSNDSRGLAQITVGGTGITSNPTITLTFKNGAWPAAPFLVATLSDNTGGAVAIVPTTVSTTAVTFTCYFTPTTGHQYLLAWMAMG